MALGDCHLEPDFDPPRGRRKRAAQAAPDVGPGCEKIRGTIYCVEYDYAGNSGNYWLDESSKKGSYSSSHEEESSATNPGGNQPPGKQ